MSAAIRVELEDGAPRRRDAAAALLLAPLLGIAGPLVPWPALILHAALPVMTAAHIATPAGRARFAAEDRPRIADGLEWYLGLCGWASLAVAGPPWRSGPRAVRLRLPPPSAPPTAATALSRLVTGLPGTAAALLAGAVALVPWLALAACVLVTGRAPARMRRGVARVLRVQAAGLCRQAGVTRPARKASASVRAVLVGLTPRGRPVADRQSGAGPNSSARSRGTGRTSVSIIGQWRSASSERAR